ncbi:MAG: DUF192 domain-containing protein [bacterium]|nr:DUF192 domain-containing protein [bacterium]
MVKVELAESFYKKALGLMFRKDFDGLMIFIFRKPCKQSFHTMFMRFPIDIFFFLGSELKEYYLAVPPWRIIRPKNKYNVVVEIKHGKFSLEEVQRYLRFNLDK